MKALKMEEIKPAVSRVLKTADGKLLMEWLERTYYDAKLNEDSLSRECGRRDVVRQLKIIGE